MNRYPANPDTYPRLRCILKKWWQRYPLLQTGLSGPVLLFMALLLLIFALLGLPFLLPLGGPDPVSPSELADPDGDFVNVDNIQLYYVHIPSDGEPVILLHGFGGSTVTWRDTMPALAASGYDVYALDLAGFGLSEKGWAIDYSHERQAARVVQFMDQMGIERAFIVGHSMGGNVAAYLAIRYPDRVGGLILVDAAAQQSNEPSDLPTGLLNLPFVRRWGQIVLRQAVSSMFSDLLLDAAYHDETVTPDLIDAYKRPLYTRDWDVALLGMVRDMRNNALPAPASSIQAPTLILWGAQIHGLIQRRVSGWTRRFRILNRSHLTR
jgi:pimeloyl-ACP methyl ester carboxylesterase